MLIDILFSLAALLISASYLFRDILILRSITIVGCIIYAIGGFLIGYHVSGMKALIFFSFVNFFINFYQIIILIIERIPIVLPEEIKSIYETCFTMMTPLNFMKLYKLTETNIVSHGVKLTIQNQAVPDLILIKQGKAAVIKDGRTISHLEAGFFIGEMSFLTEGVANATVEVTSDKLVYLLWKKEQLVKLQESNAELYSKLKKAIAINLIKKIDLHAQA